MIGVGCVSLVETLILERLVLEMSIPEQRRSGRPISVSAVPSGPSIDIWRCHSEGFRWLAWRSWQAYAMSIRSQSL